jgi:hypothetical protein
MLVMCVAAFALALVGAWLRPVWHDELYTLALARLPLDELLSALVVDSGPPLHYLLCHLLFVLVRWQEGSMLGTFMVRLPSVLAFALLPWVVWRARPDAYRGIVWGPLLVIAWLPLLYFGTEARSYAVLALVNAVVWILGPEWVDRGGRWMAAFAALAACLPILHYTGAASFFALPALAFFVAPNRRRALMAALAGAALPMLAWLPIMLGAPRASMGWLATTPGPGRPGTATLSVLAPAGPFPGLFEVSATPLPPWLSLPSRSSRCREALAEEGSPSRDRSPAGRGARFGRLERVATLLRRPHRIDGMGDGRGAGCDPHFGVVTDRSANRRRFVCRGRVGDGRDVARQPAGAAAGSRGRGRP